MGFCSDTLTLAGKCLKPASRDLAKTFTVVFVLMFFLVYSDINHLNYYRSNALKRDCFEVNTVAYC